jgi:single-strand DNA-binding protein
MDLNQVTLVGTLAGDPKIRTSPSTAPFSLITVRREERLREIVDTHTVVASEKLAQIIREYVKEGSKVFVEGRLEDGTVVAERLILLGQNTEETAVAALTANR